MVRYHVGFWRKSTNISSGKLWWSSTQMCRPTSGSQLLWDSSAVVFTWRHVNLHIFMKSWFVMITCVDHDMCKRVKSRAVTSTWRNRDILLCTTMLSTTTQTWNFQLHDSCKHMLPVVTLSDWTGWGSRAKPRTCTLSRAVSSSSSSSTRAPRSPVRWNRTSSGTCRRPNRENVRDDKMRADALDLTYYETYAQEDADAPLRLHLAPEDVADVTEALGEAPVHGNARFHGLSPATHRGNVRDFEKSPGKQILDVYVLWRVSRICIQLATILSLYDVQEIVEREIVEVVVEMTLGFTKRNCTITIAWFTLNGLWKNKNESAQQSLRYCPGFRQDIAHKLSKMLSKRYVDILTSHISDALFRVK